MNKHSLKELQLKRLEMLLSIMLEVKDEEFDHNVWLSDCGTKGCLIGHAALNPWFQEQGLSIKRNPKTRFFRPMVYDRFAIGEDFERFFGLTTSEANSLFYAGQLDRTKNNLVTILRRVIRKKRALLEAEIPKDNVEPLWISKPQVSKR